MTKVDSILEKIIIWIYVIIIYLLSIISIPMALGFIGGLIVFVGFTITDEIKNIIQTKKKVE